MDIYIYIHNEAHVSCVARHVGTWEFQQVASDNDTEAYSSDYEAGSSQSRKLGGSFSEVRDVARYKKYN